MFAAPPAVEARIFAEIPERFLVRHKKSMWGEVHLGSADLPVFLEGPSFDGDGNLWVVDIPWGSLVQDHAGPRGELRVGIRRPAPMDSSSIRTDALSLQTARTASWCSIRGPA